MPTPKPTAAQLKVLQRMTEDPPWDLLHTRDYYGHWYLSSPYLERGRMPFRRTERVATATYKKLVALGYLTPDGKLTPSGRAAGGEG